MGQRKTGIPPSSIQKINVVVMGKDGVGKSGKYICWLIDCYSMMSWIMMKWKWKFTLKLICLAAFKEVNSRSCRLKSRILFLVGSVCNSIKTHIHHIWRRTSWLRDSRKKSSEATTRVSSLLFSNVSALCSLFSADCDRKCDLRQCQYRTRSAPRFDSRFLRYLYRQYRLNKSWHLKHSQITTCVPQPYPLKGPSLLNDLVGRPESDRFTRAASRSVHSYGSFSFSNPKPSVRSAKHIQ